MGQADYYQAGGWNAVCYECGRKRKASTLKRHWQGYWVCPEHWEPRQPQDFVRAVADLQTPPWTQAWPDPFPPIITPAALRFTPDIWPDTIEQSAQKRRRDFIAYNPLIGGSGGAGIAYPNYFNSTGWLTQAFSSIGTTEVIAQLGGNGISYGPGFALDAGITFLGESTISGDWQTPVPAGVLTAVAAGIVSWRYEMFIRFTGGTDNSGDFVYFAPLGSGVGTFVVRFGWGASGVGAILMAEWVTNVSSGAGSVNGTMVRPNTTDWYHFAFQYNSTNKIMSAYLGGIYIWGHGNGTTTPWTAGTGLQMIVGISSGPDNVGGATIRTNLPVSLRYPIVTINASAFTPPTTRLTIL